MRKRRLSKTPRARREREKRIRLHEPLLRAHAMLAPVLRLVNAAALPEGQRASALDVAAFALAEDYGAVHRDNWSPNPSPARLKETRRGARLSARLLRNWKPGAVRVLLVGVEPSAEYVLADDGAVELVASCCAGRVEQLAALSIGRARAALRDVPDWEARLKTCTNPVCTKLLFDATRPQNRIYCCAFCSNRHNQMQLRLGPEYKARVASGNFTFSPCLHC